MSPEEREKILADIQLALKNFPKVIQQKKRAHRHKERIMKPFMKLARQLEKRIAEQLSSSKDGESIDGLDKLLAPVVGGETHAWRVCPIGSHFVKAHVRKLGGGKTTAVKAYCQKNRSRLDVLNAAEITEISRIHFGAIDALPCPKMYEFDSRQNVDSYIAGWVKYWNDVMKPRIALTPNVVKALIASESSFNNLKSRPAGKGEGKVYGLMQVTDGTLRVLRSRNIEVKDHLVDVNGEDLMEPTVNICVGIRWLFHKRKLAEAKLGGDVSWDDAVIFYKGYRNKPADELARKMLPFRTFMEKLEKCQ